MRKAGAIKQEEGGNCEKLSHGNPSAYVPTAITSRHDSRFKGGTVLRPTLACGENPESPNLLNRFST